MKWKHIAGFGIAAALTAVGALTGTLPAILPIATGIIGAIAGHAQGSNGNGKVHQLNIEVHTPPPELVGPPPGRKL